MVCHAGERPALETLVPSVYSVADLQRPEHANVAPGHLRDVANGLRVALGAALGAEDGPMGPGARVDLYASSKASDCNKYPETKSCVEQH